VVFSQWTTLLDIVAAVFTAHNPPIQYVRLDGAMTSRKRKDAITSFRLDAGIKVFLISLKAGGVGLNLNAANYVFLLDPWWNPAAEDQAVDRSHRLGQTRPVYVVRLIAAKSVEERIVELQQRKRQMTQAALHTSRAQGEAPVENERLLELRALFK